VKKYTESHDWIVIDGSTATIGITQYAAEDIGEITFVELPTVGEFLEKDDICCVVESSKAAIDIASPVSGKVVKVNEALSTSPDLMNKSAEEQGWIYQIELSDPKELDVLS